LNSMEAVVGDGVGRENGPFLEDAGIVVIGVRRIGILRVGDEETRRPIISCMALCA